MDTGLPSSAEAPVFTKESGGTAYAMAGLFRRSKTSSCGQVCVPIASLVSCTRQAALQGFMTKHIS